MKTKIKRLLLAALLLSIPVSPLHAQIIADGATRTLINETNSFTGDVTVGTNGAFTLLVLSDNALLTNSANGIIGRNATAKSNEVQLLSATARWQMGGSLFVGSNGAFNQLVVSNGAFLNNNNGLLGNGAAGSNNLALVTGSGSLWSNRIDLTVGVSGRDNQMIVSNGARVASRIGNIGSQTGSSNNLVVVTGSGSSWTNHLDMNVGFGERSNRLVIEAGGQVGGDNGRVGGGVFGSGSEALVTGPGSLWSSRTDLAVGLNPPNNRLVVSNGAAVVAGNNGRVGVSTPATGNVVVVTGSGSLWSNQFELYVGEGGPRNRMEVNDGGRVLSSNTYVGYLSASNITLVTGAGSMWSNRAGMYVGHSSSANQLVVSNGALVVNSNGYLGFNVSGSNNFALLTGAGTLWSHRNDFVVGNSGVGNQVVVSNGARVVARESRVGVNASSRSNVVFVSGFGSIWSNALAFNLGEFGSANQLIVSNGAVLAGSLGAIGNFASSSNNVAVITGQGTRWSAIGGTLLVGGGGSGNRLVISDDATVFDFGGRIGTFEGSVNNEALVSDGHWSTDSLTIGNFGAGNRLIITNNGVVFSDREIVVGVEVSSTNNRVVVDGGSMRTVNVGGRLDVRRGTNVFNAGLIEANQLLLTNALGKFEFNGGTLITRGAVISNGANFVVGNFGPAPAVWDVRAGPSNHVLPGYLTLGNFSSFNQLLVTNGALLTNYLAFIAPNINARSNTAVIAGPGSRWEMVQLEVGSSGSFNSLVVSNGGSVTDTFGYLGLNGSNNMALVTGSNSVWSNAGDLRVGDSDHSNQLIVSDGGTVRNNSAYFGFNSDGSNNLVLVTGSGSAWTNASDLWFGLAGAGNVLVVSNGGFVRNNNAYVSMNFSSSNNVAVVTGSGSVWSNAVLSLGRYGPGNRLLVSSGGVVRSDTTYLGLDDVRSSNNVALVTDSGSALHNANSLFVGDFGAHNQLVVSNGATVQGNYGLVGVATSGSNNLALVTGSGSVWSNALELQIGFSSRGNQLVVSNSAMVAVGNGFIGRNAGANQNTVIVTDPGTRWLLSSNLYVGSNGAFSRLVISNGARVENSLGTIGHTAASSNNLTLVTGPGSVWSNANDLYIGNLGSGNQLVVSNAAVVQAKNGLVGSGAGGNSNAVVVTGSGSVWSNAITVNIGYSGAGNLLVVSNGGTVLNGYGSLGLTVTGSNNVAVVTGPGSMWSNKFELYVGENGAGNQLVVSNGGVVFARDAVYLGFGTTNNGIEINGGSLLVSNVSENGFLDIRRGTAILRAGLIEVNRLLLTNSGGFLQFNGGTLSTVNSRVSHGTLFDIGNGTSPATFILAGNGLHEFTGILAARVSSNANFTGNGTIGGVVPLQFRPGSQLSPGIPQSGIGKMIFSNSPSLQGAIIMELSKTSATLTNDQIQVIGALTYGGSLTVTNLGPDALTNGDSFQLFAASSYASSFSSLVLPALPPGLVWKNNLLVDGSIQVVARDFGVDVSHFQGEGGVSQSSWNQMFTAGKRFAFIKATEGLSVLDAAMENNVNRATAAGLRAGVYHFAHPELRPTTNGAIQEADYLLSYAGNFVGPGHLRPVLDLEFNAATLSTADLTDWVIAFANEIITNRGIGAAPIIYCNQSFANNEFDSRLAGYDLWLRTITAIDVSTNEPPSGFPDPTGVFDNWSFWQYSDTGSSGGISPLDLNVCHSEFKSLDSFLIPAVTNPVPPAIVTQPQDRTVTASNNATFNVAVSVSSSTPLFYQWRFDGTNLAGATANSYTRFNAQLTDAGPYTVVITNAGGSLTSTVATLTVTNPPPTAPPIVLYFENFDGYSSPSVVTSPATTNGFKIFFGATGGPFDFSARFGFDYSTVTSPTNIPSAPNSTNGTTKGLYLIVNKDGTPAAAAINLYPVSQTFTGTVALKFDLWINYPNTGTATEHALFGINHSANVTNRVGQLTSDGLFFAMDGDGGATSGSATLRDFAVFRGGGSGAIPVLLTTANTVFGPAPLLGANFDNADAGFAGLFPSKTLPSFTTVAGTAGNGWVSVEVRQETNLITWLLNNTVVAQYTNTSTFTNGNLLIGYNDNFSSIGGVDNFAIFDNLRMEAPGPIPTAIQLAGMSVALNGAFQFSFTNTPGAVFTVLATTNAALPLSNWTVLGAVTEISPGQFQFSDPQATNNVQRYYRVRWP